MTRLFQKSTLEYKENQHTIKLVDLEITEPQKTGGQFQEPVYESKLARLY